MTDVLTTEVKVKVAQSHPILCDSTDYTVHGILQARMLEWVAFPFSRDLSNPGIEPRSSTLQADSLPAESQGKSKNTGVGSLSHLHQIFPTRNRTRVSCIAGRFFTKWAIREALKASYKLYKYWQELILSTYWGPKRKVLLLPHFSDGETNQNLTKQSGWRTLSTGNLHVKSCSNQRVFGSWQQRKDSSH